MLTCHGCYILTKYYVKFYHTGKSFNFITDKCLPLFRLCSFSLEYSRIITHKIITKPRKRFPRSIKCI